MEQKIIIDKIPPQAVDIECAILGALLVDKECRYVIDKIIPEMFYVEKHVEIFKAIKELFNNKEGVDILTVTQKVGDPVYVTKLTANVGSGLHIGEYTLILIQKYLQRELIRRCYQLAEKQYDDQDVEDSLRELVDINKDINNIITQGLSLKSYYDLIEESKELLNLRIANRNKGIKPGISIPFEHLQNCIGGWQRGDLIYIAARPGMGKTAVSIVFAKEAAKAGNKVLFFSLEMSDIAITDRAVLGETEVNPDDWKLGKVTDFDISSVDKVQDDSIDIELFIIDKSAVKATEISTICRKEQPDIVFVDYIQLMTPERTLGNRNLELGEISHKLKEIAKEFKIPVIAMAQLNRDVEKRGDRKPLLSDLRDSGELEQDADIVIMLFRQDFYEGTETQIIELNVNKHRNGRTGRVLIKHNQYMNKFTQIEENSF